MHVLEYLGLTLPCVISQLDGCGKVFYKSGHLGVSCETFWKWNTLFLLLLLHNSNTFLFWNKTAVSTDEKIRHMVQIWIRQKIQLKDHIVISVILLK